MNKTLVPRDAPIVVEKTSEYRTEYDFCLTVNPIGSFREDSEKNPDGTATTEYDEAGDVWFFKGEGTPVTVKAGEFYIVHPFDLHAPAKGREPKPFKKAIIKILI